MDQNVKDRLNHRLGFDGDFKFGDWAEQMESAAGFGLNNIYVDGTFGNDSADGLSKSTAKKTIQAGVNVCPAGGTVRIVPRYIAAAVTDPTSYDENIIIPPSKSNISLIGIGSRAQGGIPQIKKGSGSSPLITVRAAGVTIAYLGINGNGSTGGGILIDSDAGGANTKDAFGLSIIGCHFKNCIVSATDGAQGGAITWCANGGSWGVLIQGNRFYKNIADVVLLGTALTVPQDVVIQDNIFSDSASADINLHLGQGSGMNQVNIDRNVFPALPALSAGGTKRFMNLAGCVGSLTRNTFGCINTLTFKKASMGTAAYVPATVLMADNWGEDCTTPFVHTA
jgi:hypothetical protein